VKTRATHLVYQYMVLDVQNLSVYPVSESPNLSFIFSNLEIIIIEKLLIILIQWS